MGVVSFRLSNEDEKKLRAMGVNPGARAKELLEDELRKRRIRENMEWLARHAARGRGPSAVQIIRQMREEG